MLRVDAVRIESQKNPLGLDVKSPRFSWKLESDRRNVWQRGYQIQVSTDERGLLWDSEFIESDASIQVPYQGPPLCPRTRYQVRVRVWDDAEACSDWTKGAFWETGMGQERWVGSWITADFALSPDIAQGARPSPLLRKAFDLGAAVRGARIYASSLGLYELYVNGQRVGDMLLTPGWTSYHHRVQYQTYDVTDLLRPGANVLGAMLGSGWYLGEMGWQKQRQKYGDTRALLAELHVTLEDGTNMVVATDDSWRYHFGPIAWSEIYHGESYDARKQCLGWNHPGFDEATWPRVMAYSSASDVLVAQSNEPIRVRQIQKAVSLFKTPRGDRVIDFGQNLTGWVRFIVRGSPGQQVRLDHAEVLDAEGNFYTENLRGARQTIAYICQGNGVEQFQPHFTYQGFRYIRLVGFPEEVFLSDFEALVMHSDLEITMRFRSSNALVNRLQQNIVWSQRGNFLDVPTDCPQRDERLGWTGDAQVFVGTACYQMQSGSFFDKWLFDLAADQWANGSVPHVIPDVLTGEPPTDIGTAGSAGWGDAAVIIPWTLYLMYGDERVLARQYPSMRAWVEFMQGQGPDPTRFRGGRHFGDWLGLDARPGSYVGATPSELICQAFYAHSTHILMKTARVLGYGKDAQAYETLHSAVVQAFQSDFIGEDGDLISGTQTAYVLAIWFDLLPSRLRQATAERLRANLGQHAWHLTTGFLGTPYLLHALTAAGDVQAAYRLLLQASMPSWLYPVLKGATTVWEHWDGLKEDGSMWSPAMNSFNHYAYGAVGEWLYRVMGGINPDETHPGFKEMVLAPKPSPGIDWLALEYTSAYGPIGVAWQRQDHAFHLQVKIPANTKALVVLPHHRIVDVVRNWDEPPLERRQGQLMVKLGSGSYRLSYRLPTSEVKEGS